MSDDPREQDHQSPPMLSYQTPERLSGAATGFAVTVGTLLGIIAMAFLGAVLTPMVPRRPPRSQIFVFLVLALLAVVGSISVSRLKPHTSGRWFWFGALIGGGVTALIEGLCFATFS